MTVRLLLCTDACNLSAPLAPPHTLQERLVDIVFCNEQEAEALCQVRPSCSSAAAQRRAPC